MLTRRHIRVKVLQSIYAFQQSSDADIAKQEKFLIYSMEQMHDLYLLLLHLMINVRQHAEQFIEKSQKKHLATQEDLQPNMKFVNNVLLSALANNTKLENLINQRKLNNWKEDNEYVSIIFNALRSTDLYKNYLATTESTFAEDKNFIIDFFKQIIAPNDKLYDYLEDKRLTWLDDYPLVNTSIVKMLKGLTPKTIDKDIVLNLYKNEEDSGFASQLFKKVVLHEESLSKEIVGRTPNWDQDRIASLDLIIIKMGIIEFQHFPSIPIKVTINEYLEIAKEYSTPKSSMFINGILDKLVKDYKTNNKLNKIGRGLI